MMPTMVYRPWGARGRLAVTFDRNYMPPLSANTIQMARVESLVCHTKRKPQEQHGSGANSRHYEVIARLQSESQVGAGALAPRGAPAALSLGVGETMQWDSRTAAKHGFLVGGEVESFLAKEPGRDRAGREFLGKRALEIRAAPPSAVQPDKILFCVFGDVSGITSKGGVAVSFCFAVHSRNSLHSGGRPGCSTCNTDGSSGYSAMATPFYSKNVKQKLRTSGREFWKFEKETASNRRTWR